MNFSLRKKIIITILFVSFFIGGQALAQGSSSRFSFQIMPPTRACPDCECDCPGGDIACLKRCISACERRSEESERRYCKHNMCYAGNKDDYENGMEPIDDEGIYQCSECSLTGDCTLTDFLQVFVNVANIILILSGIFGMIMIVYSGLQFLTSMGDQNKVASGLKGMKNVFFGILIVFFAWFIVEQVQVMFGFREDLMLRTVDVGGGTGAEIDPGDVGEAVGTCVPDMITSSVVNPPAICTTADIDGRCASGYEYQAHDIRDIEGCQYQSCYYGTGDGLTCGPGSKMTCGDRFRMPCVFETSASGCQVVGGQCFFFGQYGSTSFCPDSYNSCLAPTLWGPNELYRR